MNRLLALALGIILASPLPALAQKLIPAFPNLEPFERPVFATQVPGDPAYWYVIEQEGKLWRFKNDPKVRERTLVIDITGRVRSICNECGLLGVAFHPEFKDNGRVFLSFTVSENLLGMDSVLSEFKSPDGGASLDPESERRLIRIDQPYSNHNGGGIVFGPDGYLYYGMGDGGSGGDPKGNGQNPKTLMGAMIRIDVDSKSDGKPYGIPTGNPFAAGKKGAPEVFAFGLRNPWRFSFDRKSGALWAGDAGQNEWEEIDRIQAGKNYGWNIREGAHCYPPGKEKCRTKGLVDPVAEYDHSEGQSVTGGYVYRGKKIPALNGSYLFADFVKGTVWALRDPYDKAERETLIEQTGLGIASFTEDHEGELYVLDLFGGRIHKLVK